MDYKGYDKAELKCHIDLVKENTTEEYTAEAAIILNVLVIHRLFRREFLLIKLRLKFLIQDIVFLFKISVILCEDEIH